ncbi:MAG TPA: hypothetical protein PKN87_07280 [Syntrophomonadaceae bacterium]|nr:hypothetical protein [Syntrophomonadaceae bacterium]HNX29202.1 hypothetical protein [Syntrophomonadaceae bacterium]HPR92570.1 hypothetical protein [Syntrophomonadaceae bacterium]
MINLGRYLIVFLLLILVGTALNIGNGAINQLTGQNRQAVIGADYEQDSVFIYIMGESYAYDRDRLYERIDFIESKTRQSADNIIQYFIRYINIFQAVFLQ